MMGIDILSHTRNMTPEQAEIFRLFIRHYAEPAAAQAMALWTPENE